MRQIYILLICIGCAIFGNANELTNEQGVDCLILEDENSIICKYSHTRVAYDKHIIMQWIEPSGLVTRERELLVPAFHGSIYDYRYIEGRSEGEWTFKVIDNQETFSTTFTLE